MEMNIVILLRIDRRIYVLEPVHLGGAGLGAEQWVQCNACIGPETVELLSTVSGWTACHTAKVTLWMGSEWPYLKPRKPHGQEEGAGKCIVDKR